MFSAASEQSAAAQGLSASAEITMRATAKVQSSGTATKIARTKLPR